MNELDALIDVVSPLNRSRVAEIKAALAKERASRPCVTDADYTMACYRLLHLKRAAEEYNCEVNLRGNLAPQAVTAERALRDSIKMAEEFLEGETK